MRVRLFKILPTTEILQIETVNVPVERLQATFTFTPGDLVSPLQPGCYAAIKSIKPA